MGFVDPGSVLVLNHPDAIRHVLQDNHSAYIKGVLYDDLRRLLGQGLLTVDDDEVWARQRRRAQPVFQPSTIDAYLPVMADTIATMLREWRRRARPGRAVDICPVMSRLTLRVIAKALFGLDLGTHEDKVLGALTEFFTFDTRSRGPVMGRLYRYLPFWATMRAYRARRMLDESVRWIEANRPPRGDDLISRLGAGPDDSDQSAEQRLRDEIVTILVAGHETTAIALGWALHSLNQHPEVEQRIRAEVEEVLGPRLPDPSDMPRLAYTAMVIKETLRLFPPVPTIARQAIEEDEIAGFRIAAGTLVRVKPGLIHRHPDFWTEPDRFVPERFSSGDSPAHVPYTYIPFGAGPRTCIGNHFAMLEMRLALAMIVRAVRFRPVKGRPPDLVLSNITLRPRFGLWMTPEFTGGVEWMR
jgi:cytochrome P450